MVVFVKPRKDYKPPTNDKGERIVRQPFKLGTGVELKGLPTSPVYEQVRDEWGSLQKPRLLGYAATLSEAESVAKGAVIWVTADKGDGGVWWKHTPRR